MSKKPYIIIINGISFAGKDTFCMFCDMFVNTVVMSTVDRVKELATKYFGWNGRKDEAGRKLLADLRSAWNLYNNGSNDYVINEIASGGTIDKNVELIFIMIREFNEMIYVQDNLMREGFIVKTMWVDRMGNIPGSTERKFIEMIPNNFSFDYEINNHKDLAQLALDAHAFCVKLYPSSEHDRKVEILQTTPMVAVDIAKQFDKRRGYENHI